MSKHALSSALHPPAKRLHTASSSRTQEQEHLDLGSLYDELILHIFSHLSWVDLCAAQATSKNWCRLAADNELWRILYSKVYGRPRLRGPKSYVVRSDGREVRPLPSRAKSDMDWKWMFRISSNWRRGRCRIEPLLAASSSITHDLDASHATHVLIAGPLTITTSSRTLRMPVISLYDHASNTKQSLECQSRQWQGPYRITALATDQSCPSHDRLRLACFLSTGEFIIYDLNHANPALSARLLTYITTRTANKSVVQAAYNHPLLVTLTESFSLSIYDLSDNSVNHTQTLTSFTSFPPSSMVLSAPTPSSYRLILAYSVPVYPAHWSVGATEIIISARQPMPAAEGDHLLDSTEPMRVTSTRTIRANDVPTGWIDEAKLQAMRDQWSRKVARVADTQTDGKWVVLASGESTPDPWTAGTASLSSMDESTLDNLMNSTANLQLYRLSLPSRSDSIAAASPKLTFVRSLHGQTGAISSLALADGRCVSLGVNGSVWVWDLEVGTGTEIPESNTLLQRMNGELVKGSVAFDDRRIVTAEVDRVTVCNFDI